MSDEGYEPDEGEQPIVDVEQSFAAETNKLGKLKLQPFTPMRRIAAQAMKLHYGKVDPAGIDDYQKTFIYPGMERDIAIILWLRFTTDRFEIDQAGRDPVSATEKAVEWAEKQGITNAKSDLFWQARDILFATMEAIRAAETEPKKKAQRKARKKR